MPTSFTVAQCNLADGCPITRHAVPPPGTPCRRRLHGGTSTASSSTTSSGPDRAPTPSYINLDGKYKATDHLTISGQIGYTQGQGDTNGSPSFEVDARDRHLLRALRQRLGRSRRPPSIRQSPAGLSNDWAWNERVPLAGHGNLRPGRRQVRRSTTASSRTSTFGFHASRPHPSGGRLGPRLHAGRQRRLLDLADHAVLGDQPAALSERLQRRRAGHPRPADPDRRQPEHDRQTS